MRITRIIALAALGCGVFAAGASAQTLRSAQVPAEFPPSSFTGTQYVDSAGCVFIRAGIDGNTTWVPRVNRQRRQICGQTPSLTATARAQTAPAAAAPKVEQITVAPPTPAPAPAPRTTRTQPRVVATPAPAPKPTPKPASRVATKPATQIAAVRVTRPAPQPAPAPARVAAAPRPVPAPAPQATVRAAPACPGASSISSRYINSGTRYPVRCGPQPLASHGGAAASAVTVDADTRVVPRQVYDKRLQEQGADQIPPGYRPVWTDDRLNPRRAEQSLRGIAQTRLFWTNTVPRRLIDHSSGRDVTAEIALVYPYTDVDTQQRDLGTVTLVRRDGQLIKRIQRNRTRTRAAEPATTTKVERAAPKPKATKGRYVQVGTFGVDANARSTAQKLARAGLPARIGTLKRGGKSYRVVLAGPFASSGDLTTGLRKARALGFSDAFAR
ncbi:MAG: SPOR domain-containing protein [Pseudomonadota bacterium]